MIPFIEEHHKAAESSRSAASCRSLRRTDIRIPPSPAIPEKPPTGPDATPKPSRRSGVSTTKAQDGTERARSGANCVGRRAGPPDAPWSGSCGSRDCKGSRGDARRPRSRIRPRPCPQEKADRKFNADAPDRLRVADFTYVNTAMGKAYAAFAIDVFARKIVGWRVPTSMTTSFVLDALSQAICQRCPAMGALTHHSDRGMQYLSIRYADRLAEAGINMSVGSVGDSCDNALAETVIGLFKTEVVKHLGPWKTKGRLEWEIMKWCIDATRTDCMARSDAKPRTKRRMHSADKRGFSVMAIAVPHEELAGLSLCRHFRHKTRYSSGAPPSRVFHRLGRHDTFADVLTDGTLCPRSHP